VPEGYVQKILELLNNEAFRKEFGAKARQFTIDHYNWNIIAQKYLTTLEELV
jgi:glycosyltransferase involved in cell wall biosynthesis